ncbi:hypothetical protein [Humibacter sp. RRB41]|uniref:hypothetical protein n=1 Tax=Humibacter sp. RRB41 TaxID=2919946 RepID=UPI001FA9F031|nr:hypothetical protein [Humibacter sp. RRB41]
MSDAGSVSLSSNLTDSDDVSVDGDYAFIGAIHSLVSSRTSATKSDLILAAACQAIRESDKTTAEVVTVVNRIWPGANTEQDSVVIALQLGIELGLVVKKAGLDSSQLWSLTPRGVDDVDGQSSWVAELRSRTRDQLIGRAHDGLGVNIDQEAADLWLERLLRALILGIQSAQDAYMGKVEKVVGNRLIPRGIDQHKVYAALEDSRVNPATVDFLKTAALAAFDPLDPFGNEIVSLITTGCVLHSYVAGRDAAETMRRLGDPTGQRALIDTPVLVDLIGPARVRARARFLLSTAIAAGWEVIVCEHSLDELATLVEREIPKVKQSFREAHERGVKEEWYASLVEDQLTTYCVEVLRDKTYKSLDDMVTAARELSTQLVDIGVIVRPHGNDADESHVQRALAALNRELETSSTGRSTLAVERDAQSMANIWRRRRRQKGNTWPGGWIITSDRHIAPAYRTLDKSDKVPLTLSMARWGTLLSVTVPPTDVVNLAEAAATQLVEEAMWLLPSRFPSDVAMSLARQLSPESGGSELDIRYAQLTLDNSLDSAGNARTAVSLASDVLAARAKRTTLIQAEGLAEARAKQEEAQRQADAARARAEEQAAAAKAADKRAADATDRIDMLTADLSWARTRSKRILGTVIAGFLGLGVVIATFARHQPFWISLIAIVALVTIVFGGVRWVADKNARLVLVIIGGAIEAIALCASVLDLGSMIR